MARRRKWSKKDRGGRGQKARALQALYVSELSRKAARALQACVYAWSNGEAMRGRRPPYRCEECGSSAPKVVDGTPPIESDLPVARGICLPCASILEQDAREELHGPPGREG